MVTARKKGRMPLTCGSHLAETKGAGWLLPLSRELGPGGKSGALGPGRKERGEEESGPRVGRGEFGPSGRKRGKGFVLFIFYSPFFYSKTIFKTVLKITLNYF